MAIIAGVQAGKVPLQIQGATGVAPIRFGASAGVATPTTAQQVTLPLDPAGNAYSAYQVTASGSMWFCWNTGSGAATIAGANCYLITLGSQETLVAPPGATGLSVIFDGASTTGSLCVIGLF
jgi:hypothetical protein